MVKVVGRRSWPVAVFATLIAVPVAAQPAQDPPAPKPAAQSIWSSEGLTGDWGGARTDMNNKGVELELALYQLYQGVASGGLDDSSEYFGTFQTVLKSDLGKMTGWNFWSVEFKTETRFGGPLPGGSGSINPVNTAALSPKPDGEVFAITALNATRLFPIDLKTGELMAIAFGRFNLLDLLDEDFFSGAGLERFFNMAQIGPLTVLRQVPLVTNGISYAWIKRGEPFFTFALLDPNDHSTTTGLSDLFADGVTFSPALNLPAKYGGTFLNFGPGGNGPFAERPRDEFGIAYAFTDLSDELKDNLDLITDARQRAEHQFEIFYNAHLTPWFRLTGTCRSSGRPVRLPTQRSCRVSGSGSCSEFRRR